jgi:hypothetical protein
MTIIFLGGIEIIREEVNVAIKKELHYRLNWSAMYYVLGVITRVQNVGRSQVIGGCIPLDNADMGIIDTTDRL